MGVNTKIAQFVSKILKRINLYQNYIVIMPSINNVYKNGYKAVKNAHFVNKILLITNNTKKFLGIQCINKSFKISIMLIILKTLIVGGVINMAKINYLD